MTADDGILRLTNGAADLAISVDYGPRIVHYGFAGGPNVFAGSDKSIATSLGDWKVGAGHRLWIAPESMPGSYAPDVGRVMCEAVTPLTAVCRQRTDAAGIEKTIAVVLDPAGTRAVVTHTIANRTWWPLRVAPWGITIVAPDGRAVIPQPPFRPHPDALLPARPLVQWPFSDLTDLRIAIGRRLIQVTPDATRPEANKIGVGNTDGWCAWVRGDLAYVKRFAWIRGATYPDYGCNNEVFTAGDYLEIETLGPLVELAPDESTSHTEEWRLFRGVDCGESEESCYDALARLAV